MTKMKLCPVKAAFEQEHAGMIRANDIYGDDYDYSPDTDECGVIYSTMTASCETVELVDIENASLIEGMCQIYWSKGASKPYENISDTFKDEMRSGMRDILNHLTENGYKIVKVENDGRY